mmetsp:Transcript_6782/g.24702  ORF Transcript_6782/g.24702 Transcript_6782/m.24702 type:complete len:335 (-) Transcript_6782:1912-2916(-)
MPTPKYLGALPRARDSVGEFIPKCNIALFGSANTRAPLLETQCVATTEPTPFGPWSNGYNGPVSIFARSIGQSCVSVCAPPYQCDFFSTSSHRLMVNSAPCKASSGAFTSSNTPSVMPRHHASSELSVVNSIVATARNIVPSLHNTDISRPLARTSARTTDAPAVTPADNVCAAPDPSRLKSVIPPFLRTSNTVSPATTRPIATSTTPPSLVVVTPFDAVIGAVAPTGVACRLARSAPTPAAIPAVATVARTTSDRRTPAPAPSPAFDAATGVGVVTAAPPPSSSPSPSLDKANDDVAACHGTKTRRARQFRALKPVQRRVRGEEVSSHRILRG